MAELAGSIIGIVSAGTKVTLVLSQFAADVGSAGKEARMIGGEIRSFCAVIKTLGETLEKIQTSHYYGHCAELIEPMTQTSMEMFTEILDASESLKGIAKGKDPKDGKLGLVGRVQWAVFQKPKIMVLRAAIEAYKSNLALMLATLNTAEKVTRQPPVYDLPALVAEENIDRSLLKSLELEHHASMIDLEQTEQQYHESAVEESTEAISPISLQASPANTEDTLVNAQLPDKEPWMDSLVGSARDEIASIRSSLSRNSIFDAHQISGQVSLQSQRLSILLADDQQRISQRWSTPLSPSLSDFSRQSGGTMQACSTSPCHQDLAPTQSLKEDASPSDTFWPASPSTGIGFKEGALLDPSYQNILSWLVMQPFQKRVVILNTLARDACGSLHLSSNTLTALEAVSSLPNQGARESDNRHEAQDPERVREIRKLVREQILSYYEMPPNERLHGLTIDLGMQEISDFPEQLIVALHSSIARLGINHNQLTSIPRPFALCSQLRYLGLRHNKFQTIPEPVLQISSLEILDMGRNILHALPDNISTLSSLKVLVVEGNKIRGLPLVIGDMAKLVLLKCRNNPLEFPTQQALEAFMPNRYAPTPQDENEQDVQDTKRLKAFLKMTFRLSPSAQRAIQGLPPATPQSPDAVPNELSGDSYTVPLLYANQISLVPGAQSGYDSPSFASDIHPGLEASEPDPPTSQSQPAFPMLAQQPGTVGAPAQQNRPTHRKSRSHDVSNRGKVSLLSSNINTPRRRSFNISMPSYERLDVLNEEQPTQSKPVTSASHKGRPSLTVFERADLLLGRTKRRT
ncbi:hypothetical protein K458DRAFT_428257 [Lentithecium fluviatile CBS 122367]|uniref:Disease resistance R13L4/SHOC-2-like LRR domain-containing protein n=1 Tax=Lentithecium fluviatile CBS 122367 TaxID=1168545 RepID=A0A6G1JDV3_9PLEO|nr:hypothetical protein K458DRAFT_428257 [Lentithecium fluviatile CBS 122367]